MEHTMFFNGFFSGRVLILAAMVNLMLCAGGRAQGQEQGQGQAQGIGRRRDGRDAVSSMRSVESSDLPKENMERVAAFSIQLQTVFLKDPGILVELKRWVATEATNSGQIVDDDSLTDQAIFDRLDHDVSFRSVATRLVQRYGYLLPSVNPDSDIAKEQDLVLKERARRLVQIEGQEDAQALQPHPEQKVEQAADCDAERDADCGSPA